MVRIRRASMTGAVIVCLLITQWNAALFANELADPAASADASPYLTSSAPDPQMPIADLQVPTIAIEQESADMTGEPARALQQEPARLTLDSSRLNQWLAAAAPGTNREFRQTPLGFAVHGGQIYQGPPYPIHNNNASIAALAIGAIAAITGTAVLVYANRPECSVNPFADGCGYGTKVVGTAVLSGGIVGLFIGALTWR